MFGILAVVLLVLANGFFVATEFAIVAVRRSRIEQLAEQGNASAKVARLVVQHLDRYIAACQFGITIASLALGWIGEPAFAHLVEPPLESVVGGFAPAAATGIAVAVAFIIITTLHIVVGELAPKGLAIQLSERTTLWVARPIHLFYVIFKWPIIALNSIGNGTLRLFGLHAASEQEMVHSVEELQYLVSGSEQAGEIESSEARIASRAFQFADITAEDVMTPRTELEAVPEDIGLQPLLARVAAGVHTRLPVYRESLDNVVGVLNVHDLFSVLHLPTESFELSRLLRPVLFMPQQKHADDLLEEMRSSRRQMAVVIDEYGGTAGVVTLEDLLEALVGPIREEPPLHLTPTDPEGGSTDLFDGLTRLYELQDVTGMALDAYMRDGVETLGGLVMSQLGRLPVVGDTVEVEGRVLRVEALDGLRVASVRLLPLPQPSQSDGGQA